jgi:GNAT superfamily N-acetyltransferase
MIPLLDSIPIVNTTSEQRKQFDCGIHVLNDFLKRHSEPNHLKGLGKTFALLIEEKIIGYYTVSMSSTLEFINLSNFHQKKLPKYPIPVALLARLAVSKDRQKQGFGKWLLIDAIRRIFNTTQDIGAYAIVVDAKDESAKKFYLIDARKPQDL